MTNPDNVGALNDHKPVPLSEELRIEAALQEHGAAKIRLVCMVQQAERLEELCRAAPAGGDEPWRCFHCDEVFTTGEAAALHFGTREYQSPACQIDVAAYREMEALQLRYLDEDADVHRAMYRMQGEHQQALRRAEEDGYAKGVRDSEKDSAPAGSGEVENLCHSIIAMWRDRVESFGNVTDYNAGHSDACEQCARELESALLRKLQQGADYVMVPRVRFEALEASNAEYTAWLDEYHGGGDFTDFLTRYIAAQQEMAK